MGMKSLIPINHSIRATRRLFGNVSHAELTGMVPRQVQLGGMLVMRDDKCLPGSTQCRRA